MRDFHQLLPILTAVAGLGFLPNAVHAEDWMFRPSYYSHLAPGERPAPEDVPEIRSAYRRPYVYLQSGAAVRRVYRYNRINIQTGSSYDTTLFFESWYNERP